MNEFVIAKYIRLSIDDGTTESMSISHQQLLIDKHINELDIPNTKVLEFIDNGYSGTNLERPAIQEMLELVRCGRIHCIITKDFSRFSRNAMESGYYIEQVFPLYRVRFIAIGDYFDSASYKDGTGGIDVAFKFLMHEYYSKDLSQKVKSAKRIKMINGESIVTNAIYGYRKNNEGKWEPDPAPADIINTMFKLTLYGMSTAEIRDKLCEAKYPTPKEYIELNRGKDITPTFMWTARMVRTILDNEQYTGTYISGKQVSKAIGSHSKANVDKSDWIVIPDSHPPIVSKEDFEAVHQLKLYRKGSTTTKPLKVDMTKPRRNKMASGAFIAATPIYGYKKTSNGKWEIDEAACIVVRKIYNMYIEGISYNDMRKKLKEANYPIPFDYIKMSRGNNITPSTDWTEKSIRSILKNIQYTGAYVSGKILKDYETGRSYHTPEDEWIIIPNNHPAIIEPEIYNKVQEMARKARIRRQNMKPRDYLLKGKIACACCGYALVNDASAHNTLYRCIRTRADINAKCHKMKTDANELENAVLSIIRKQAQVVLGQTELTDLKKKSYDERRLEEYEKELSKLVEQQQNYYEQFILNEIDKETYMSLKDACASQINDLNVRLSILKQAERDKKANKKIVAVVNEALSDTATDKDIINALVDKILFYPDNRIEIKWKFVELEKGV